MKALPALLLAALLLMAATPASAQMTFDETQQIRIGYGDIPSTDAVERPGAWNFEETRVVAMEDGPVTFHLSLNHAVPETMCDCNFTTDQAGNEVTVTFPDGASGEATLVFTHWVGGEPDRIADRLTLTDDARVFLYAPNGAQVQGAAAATSPGTSPSDPSRTIHDFSGDLPPDFWFTVLPATTAPGGDGPSFGFDFVTLLLGVIAGAGIWAFLVTQGVVQKRSRKQVAGTAAHKEVATGQSKSMLEARKRILMAGLKDLELAKQDQAIDTATYDALKAEWKKQTVTVMRALEEAKASEE